MRNIIRGMLALLLVFPLLIVGGTSTSAANRTPGCVTISEWRRVDFNQTKQKVELGIFGMRGQLAVRWHTDEGYLAKTYTYKPCSGLYVKGSLVAIDYRWRSVDNKWIVYDGAAVFRKLDRPAYTGAIQLEGYPMLKKTITYLDFDGNERTETFYFGLSKVELVELEVSTEEGFAETLKRIGQSTDRAKQVAYFKKMILLAYGEKSEDGRRFKKSPELSAEFEQTNAFSELYIELATNENAAVEFMNQIVPSDLSPTSGKPIGPPVVKAVSVTDSTPKDYSKLTKKELLDALKQQNEA